MSSQTRLKVLKLPFESAHIKPSRQAHMPRTLAHLTHFHSMSRASCIISAHRCLMWSAKDLISLRKCASWSWAFLSAQAILKFLSCTGSKNYVPLISFKLLLYGNLSQHIGITKTYTVRQNFSQRISACRYDFNVTLL